MPTLDEPANDPDGQRLMASLRARLARGAGARPPMERPLEDQYRPALAAIQALLVKRQALNAPEGELDDLRAMAATLRSIARVG
jgi:hypothetical protein